MDFRCYRTLFSSGSVCRCDRARPGVSRYRYSPRAYRRFTIMRANGHTLKISVAATKQVSKSFSSAIPFSLPFYISFFAGLLKTSSHLSRHRFCHRQCRTACRTNARRFSKARYLSYCLYLRRDSAAARSLETS